MKLKSGFAQRLRVKEQNMLYHSYTSQKKIGVPV